MRKDIDFHCGEEYNFPNPNNPVRAFLYEDYSIKPHSHDFYEINIIMSGTGVHRIEEARINVRTGDVFVIPPNALHAYYDTKNLNVYHIIIHRKFIYNNIEEAKKVPGFIHLTEIEPFVRGRISENAFVHLSASQFFSIKSELELIEEKSEFDKEEFIPLKKHTVWKIIYMLSYLMHEKNSIKSQNSKYEQAIVDTLEYIHCNYQNKMTIEFLCGRVFMSRATFLRSFCEICRITPTEYINRYRLQKARELAETTAISKTEIAHRCGFYDLSHMEKLMKKQKSI